MNKFDLNLMRVHEMNALEMQETEGGFVWAVVVAFIAGALLGGLIYDVAKYAGTESFNALCERASEDGYNPTADVGHR